jgi:hypothetical protein
MMAALRSCSGCSRHVRVSEPACLALLLLGAIACSGGGSSSAVSQGDGGACTAPAGVVVSSPFGRGCFGQPPNLMSMCNPGEFQMNCFAPMPPSMIFLLPDVPTPDPSLDCTVISTTTPSNEEFYCCPCAG